MSEGSVCACPAPGPAPAKPSFIRRGGWLLAALPLWVLLYAVIRPIADWAAFRLLGLTPKSHLGEAAAFFLYDTPKVLLLLMLVGYLFNAIF